MRRQESIAQKIFDNITSAIGAIPRTLNFEPKLPERKHKKAKSRAPAKKKRSTTGGRKGGARVIPLNAQKPRSTGRKAGMKKPVKGRGSGSTSRKRPKAA